MSTSISCLLAGLLSVLMPLFTARGAEGEPDLFTPEMLALQKSATNALADAKSAGDRKARAVLDAALKEWEGELAERKKTRNIRGMAVADTAIEEIRKAMAAWPAKREMELPADLRRELTEPMGRLKRQLAEAVAAADEEYRQAERQQFDLFKKAVAAADATPAEHVLLARFRKWLTESPPPRRGPRAASPADTPDAAKSPPEFFAQSSPGAEWRDLGRFTARMMGPDIFAVRVFDRTGTKEGDKPNPLSGSSSRWKYESRAKLDRGDYAFRMRRLPAHEAVDVIQWPNAGNEGVLQFRTPPSMRLPSDIGFELQYSSAALIEVPVKTEPAGARVFIDGRAYQVEGRDARSPFTMKLPAGTYAIRIALDGHVEQEAKSFAVTTGQTIAVRLIPLKEAPAKQVSVDSKQPWTDSGIMVAKGDRIMISASGQWACGSKGELCGPAGYPNTVAFNHYYLDPRNSPRLLEGKPYGALLAKVGDGAPVVVGDGKGFIAQSEGALRFDINEAADPDIRRNNRGRLDVRIMVRPAE